MFVNQSKHLNQQSHHAASQRPSTAHASTTGIPQTSQPLNSGWIGMPPGIPPGGHSGPAVITADVSSRNQTTSGGGLTMERSGTGTDSQQMNQVITILPGGPGPNGGSAGDFFAGSQVKKQPSDPLAQAAQNMVGLFDFGASDNTALSGQKGNNLGPALNVGVGGPSGPAPNLPNASTWPRGQPIPAGLMPAGATTASQQQLASGGQATAHTSSFGQGATGQGQTPTQAGSGGNFDHLRRRTNEPLNPNLSLSKTDMSNQAASNIAATQAGETAATQAQLSGPAPKTGIAGLSYHGASSPGMLQGVSSGGRLGDEGQPQAASGFMGAVGPLGTAVGGMENALGLNMSFQKRQKIHIGSSMKGAAGDATSGVGDLHSPRGLLIWLDVVSSDIYVL